MGMPTGITDAPGYRKNGRCLSMTIPFHEISFIVSESTQAAFGGTVRTLPAGLRSGLKGRFKPLLIRKFNIIQLAFSLYRHDSLDCVFVEQPIFLTNLTIIIHWNVLTYHWDFFLLYKHANCFLRVTQHFFRKHICFCHIEFTHHCIEFAALNLRPNTLHIFRNL